MRLSDSVLRALEGGGALAQRALAKRIGLAEGREGRKRLERVLRKLEEEGSVERQGAEVRLARSDGLFDAELQRRPDGSWFAVDARGRTLVVDDAAGAEPGDRVALLEGAGAAGASQVVQVVMPSGGALAGVYERGPRGGMVEVLQASPVPWLRVARDQSEGAELGELVLAKPASRGASREPWARVVERLGRPGDPEADFRALVVRHRLQIEFSDAAEEEADRARRAARAGRDADGTRRRDLRELPFATIDPASARDHDDAVYVEPGARGEGLRLWVAIADVSSFVEEGGALDREALQRGTSVYFADRAIPMLPEALSSDACSLVPDEDRRVLVASMQVRPDGSMHELRLDAAWIRSHARLSYEQAAACLEGRDGDRPASLTPAVEQSLRALKQASDWLRARRARDGAFELDLPETQLFLGEDGRPVDADVAARTDAHRAIEDAMLAANRAVAGKLVRAGVPSIYRVHEPPAPEDGAELRGRLARLGLIDSSPGRSALPLSGEELRLALERSTGSPETQAWLQVLVLRAMRQARYSEENLGHFALGFEAYCHFTSPIRRYADLVVHRAIHRLLAREKELEADSMAALALRVSIRERVAQRAEREMLALKLCALMEGRVGEEFHAHVSSVAPHGIYARVGRPRVEGFVPMSALPGEFRMDGDGMALVCVRSGRRIALGDELELRLEGVTPARGWLRFAPVEEGDPEEGGDARGATRGSGGGSAAELRGRRTAGRKGSKGKGSGRGRGRSGRRPKHKR